MIRSLITRLWIMERSRVGSVSSVRSFSRGTGGGNSTPHQHQHHQKRSTSAPPSGKWKRWTPLPLGVGFAYIAYQQYGHVRERESTKLGVTKEQQPWKPWQVSLYTSLPLRLESRLFGWISRIEIPVFLREPLIGAFARKINCDWNEAIEEDLKSYKSINEFFRRRIKPELRPLAHEPMVSPADGVFQVGGRLMNDRIEQVKGFSYSLGAFVGEDLVQKLKNKPKKDAELYYCVIYLSPADCHQFYSPVRWDIDQRRHISGYLMGVNKKAIARVPHLFSINERVLLTGEWEHGFFSMTPVGATHVGSILLECEKTLKTNSFSKRIGEVDDRHYEKSIKSDRGDMIGEFNMGSSVVLIFEAPKTFEFAAKPGEKLIYGQTLGRV
jgi:phosphatidylserine decarboxylase